jgi:predicted HAD superfamily hydrolase
MNHKDIEASKFIQREEYLILKLANALYQRAQLRAMLYTNKWGTVRSTFQPTYNYILYAAILSASNHSSSTSLEE